MPTGKGFSKWPSYNPGALRHTVLLLQQTTDVDTEGQPKQVWITIATCKAAIDDAVNESKPQGREYYQNGFISSRVTHIITIRRIKNLEVLAGMRVLFVDQRYSPPAVHTYFVEFSENTESRDVLLRLGVWEINGPA